MFQRDEVETYWDCTKLSLQALSKYMLEYAISLFITTEQQLASSRITPSYLHMEPIPVRARRSKRNTRRSCKTTAKSHEDRRHGQTTDRHHFLNHGRYLKTFPGLPLSGSQRQRHVARNSPTSQGPPAQPKTPAGAGAGAGAAKRCSHVMTRVHSLGDIGWRTTTTKKNLRSDISLNLERPWGLPAPLMATARAGEQAAVGIIILSEG